MWRPDDTAVVLDAVETVIIDRMRRRVDAAGDSYPPGTDLRESGTLGRSFTRTVVNTKGAVVNTAPYAAPVNARTRFMGVGDDISLIDDAVEARLRHIEGEL